MCGVFGFVSFDGKGPDLRRLQAIAEVTMRRGPHAFGFAWLDFAGRLRMFKRTGRIVDHLGLLAMARDARMLIGHCRFATHGDPDNNLNNHPHPADGGWIVHNGVIGAYNEIVTRNELQPVTDCDSEVLGLLIERGRGTFRKRCVEAVSSAVGGRGGPLVMLGLWSRPARMVVIRHGNPLSVGMIGGGERYYLGSLADKLPGDVMEVRDRSGFELTANCVDMIRFPRPVKGVQRGLFQT